jgi:hypothetical protein
MLGSEIHADPVGQHYAFVASISSGTESGSRSTTWLDINCPTERGRQQRRRRPSSDWSIDR